MNIRVTLQQTLALTFCLWLTGCASLSIPKQPSDEYITTALENNNFDTALMAVDKWQDNDPGNPELPKQRKIITQAISQFETNTLNAAKKLDAEGQWQDTKNTYENALEKLPSSQTLQNAYSEFSVRHLKHINALKEELDVAQANHWLNIRSNIKAVHHAAPYDKEARAWKQQSESERDDLARRLIAYGQAHEDNKHLGTAALRYDLAYKLAPNEFTKPYHERAAKTFAKRNETKKKRAKENQQRQQSKLSLLIDEFDRHLSKEQFRLARQTLGAMEIIDAKSPQVQARKEKLDKQRNIVLDKAILEGKKFYTKGEFESAITVWKRALQLDPDNKELKENIQRAEKFHENLERLKQGS